MLGRLGFLHRIADDTVAQVFRAGILYREGFGDRDELERLVDAVATYSRAQPLGAVSMQWRGAPRRLPDGTVRRGVFRSASSVRLPEETRDAPVELWLPPGGQRGPVCVLLAATGEEGFFRRRPFARRLLAEGIGALLLENPFYGPRRRRGQRGPALRTVQDQFAMNLATVDEARDLLGWLRAEGFGPVGVTGYSQGGFMAAFAAALVDFPVVAVPRGAGTSAIPVFTRSALSRGIHWPALSRDVGGEARARDAMTRYLTPVDVTMHGPPSSPELATVLVVRHDRFVPPEDGEALHRHWSGSTLAWSEAGHVTSVVLDGGEHVRVVVDAFRRARNAASVRAP